MKDIRVLKRHPKGGRQREIGEVYPAPDKFADLMVILGKAEYADFLVHDEPEPEAKTEEPEVVQEPGPQPEEPKASETVAKEAEELGIDLEQVKGTGKNGRILRRDLREYNTRMMRAE